MRRKYRAFISHSRADEVWGERLHRTLARYSPPRALIGTEGSDGPVPKRLAPIFRSGDGASSPSEPNVAAAAALEESDYLIVICSPRAAASERVDEDVLTFKRLSRENRIICLIVDGEPNASEIQGKETIECLPSAARFEIDVDGAVTDRRATPIVVDARDGGDAWRAARLTLAARLLGVDDEDLRRGELVRRRWRGAGLAAATAGLIALAGFSAMKEREAQMAELAEASRAAAFRVHAALDRGDEAAAILAVERAFRAVGALDPAAEGATPEGLAALTRVALETRLLADYAAPAGGTVETMRLLPEGALAIVEAGGRTHLMDPGTGEITTVYRPDRLTYTRISEDGDTLWTARLEAEREDEDGSRFTPLLFEEAELATGDVRLATAVKSVPSYGGSAAISPDGSLFAIDLGPGSGDETVVAAFRREAQELAGVVTIPSDRADIRFVDDDVILAVAPAASNGSGLGVFLWRIGEGAPQVLRDPAAPLACAPGGAPKLDARPHLSIAPFGREAALYIGDGEGGCFQRWSLPGGEAAPTLRVEAGGDWGEVLAANKTYVYGAGSDDAGGPPRRISPAAPERPRLLRGCGAGWLQRLDVIGGRASIFCADGGEEGGAEGGAAALHFGPSGQLRWSGAAHQGELRAIAYDRAAKRLFTVGDDARLRIWDAAPRSAGVAKTETATRLIRGDAGRVLAITEDGVARKLGVDGGPVGPLTALSSGDLATLTALAGDLFAIPIDRASSSGATEDQNSLSIFDAASGEVVASVDGLRSGEGGRPVVSPDRRRFLAPLANGTVALGDGSTGAVIETIRLEDGQTILAAALSEKSYALIAADAGRSGPDTRTMRLFIGAEGAAPSLVGEWEAEAADLALSEDGARALIQLRGTPTAGAEILALNLEDDTQRSLATAERPFAWFGLAPGGGRAHFAPAGEASGADGALLTGPMVVDMATGRATAKLPSMERAGPDPVWSPNGAMVAHPGPPLRIFDAATGAEICPGLSEEAARKIVFSPRATRIAVQRPWSDGGEGVEIYDLAACAPLRRIGAETAFAAPLFIDEDRLWLPLPGEIAEAPLSVDPARALALIRSRAARLGAE
ncbi:MAG: hypothetical protein AAFN79_08285 [Pseudomonadota bacterium]